MTSDPPRSRLQRFLRFGTATAVVLYAVQVTIALGMWIHLDSRTVGSAIRVHGSAHPIPGTRSVVQVGVYDRHSHRFRPVDRVGVRVVGDGVDEPLDVSLPIDAVDMARARYVVPDEPFDLVVDVAAGDYERRIEVPVAPARGTPWLEDGDHLSGPGAPRAGNVSQDDEQPRVVLRDADDDCGYQVSVVAASGVVARDIPGRLYVRIVDADGEPVSSVLIEVGVPDGSTARPLRVVTDVMGTASFSFTAGWSDDWTLDMSCGDRTVRRTVHVVPSWDGMLVRPTRPVVQAGHAFMLRAEHQRQHGDWYVDMVCDGRLLRAERHRVVHGTSETELYAPSAESGGDGARLCAIQGYTIPLAPDPPRSVHHVLVSDAGVAPRDALATLTRAVATRGDDDRTPFVGPRTLRALTAAEDRAVETYGAWLLSTLPQPFVPLPLLYDDQDAAMAEFEAARDEVRGRIVGVLAVDVVILFAVLLGIILPRAARQREAMRRLVDELDAGEIVDADAGDGALLGGRRTLLALGLGVAVLVGFLVGLFSLFHYLRAV